MVVLWLALGATGLAVEANEPEAVDDRILRRLLQRSMEQAHVFYPIRYGKLH
jgi:hypothetical protein